MIKTLNGVPVVNTGPTEGLYLMVQFLNNLAEEIDDIHNKYIKKDCSDNNNCSKKEKRYRCNEETGNIEEY